MGVEKIIVLEGGRYEMVVNSRFNDLEGGVGLKRVWVFVPEVGFKRNEILENRLVPKTSTKPSPHECGNNCGH